MSHICSPFLFCFYKYTTLISITFERISLHQVTLESTFCLWWPLPSVSASVSVFDTFSSIYSAIQYEQEPVFACNSEWLFYSSLNAMMGGVLLQSEDDASATGTRVKPHRHGAQTDVQTKHRESDANIWRKVCDEQTQSSLTETAGHCVGCCAALQTQWGACVMALPLVHTQTLTHTLTRTKTFTQFAHIWNKDTQLGFTYFRFLRVS